MSITSFTLYLARQNQYWRSCCYGTSVAYLRPFERELVGHIQNRWGPTRVGPFGLLQPLTESGLEVYLQRGHHSPYVNNPLYLLAPLLALAFRRSPQLR